MEQTTPIIDAADIRASIIVCTYNRADSLVKTLEALSRLDAPSIRSWELLVVDNNSSDHTREVVQRYADRLKNLRYLFEPTQGLSHARNRGIREAEGEILLFTDDDVQPEPDWLERILTGMQQNDCMACGGYIAPIWEREPPAWLTERFYGFLAIKTDTRPSVELKNGDALPFGANMAFRREVFERLGLFDTGRGRKGAVLASGEDGEMFERLLAAGMKVMHFGEARVHHRVEAFRVEKRYFRRWRYQTSINLAQTRGLTGERRLKGIPFYVFPQLMRALGRALWSRLTRPADEAFNREIIVWHFLGTIRGLYRRSQY